MCKPFSNLLDLEFEYKEHMLKFQDVRVSGTVSKGHSTLYEQGWRDISFQIDMTAQEIQDWVVEDFEDNDQPVPSWAYTDGQAIQDVMRDRIEMLIDAG